MLGMFSQAEQHIFSCLKSQRSYADARTGRSTIRGSKQRRRCLQTKKVMVMMLQVMGK